MIALKDYHVHSSFSDGKDSPEDIVLYAISKGLNEIGFSDHSYIENDVGYCMKKGGVSEYKKEINRLKEKYKDKISVLCGIEQDYYSKTVPKGFDYVIGSVHFVKVSDGLLPIDLDEKVFVNGVKKYFGGDYFSLSELYFETVSKIYEKTKCNIVGHIDLISKFNEGNRLFDEGDDRYVKAYKRAVDKLVKSNVKFEINTGAISRKYKSEPYPSSKIKEYIEKMGGEFIFSSDAHKKEDLAFYFEKL